MIVQPDFPEHWKTRGLVKLTGDESSPMCVIRLWAHCQHSRRALFPEMTPSQLASICRWGDRKPACHVAMVKAGFVDKLKPKGFAAHEWNDHNRQLLQKWEAGARGGRPAGENSEKFSKIPENSQLLLSDHQSDQHGKTEGSEKPTGNRDETRSDRPDQTRPD
jgi:hypothetical protein